MVHIKLFSLFYIINIIILARNIYSSENVFTSQLSSSAQSALQTVFACYRVNPSYTGPTFRFRRSSDNNQTNFFADSQGNLGTSLNAMGQSLLSWLSIGGSSTIPYVSKWYDQSGNGRFAYQSTAANQPKYNRTLLLVDFTPTGRYLDMNTASFSLGNNPYTVTARHGIMGTCTSSWCSIFQLGANSGSQCFGLLITSGRRYYDSWYSNDVTFGTSVVSGNVVSMSYNQSRRSHFVNGVLSSNVAASSHNTQAANAYLGFSGAGGVSHMNGQLIYLFSFNSALTSSDRLIVEGFAPTSQPSPNPSTQPSTKPSTVIPSRTPSQSPSGIPSMAPSRSPTVPPSCVPTNTPSSNPSYLPTTVPSTTVPTRNPSKVPSVAPSYTPTVLPSFAPSSLPTTTPSGYPSVNPTTTSPTSYPSQHPSLVPTNNPTMLPSFNPSYLPTTTPSSYPSANPTTTSPTSGPSQVPSVGPTNNPSVLPSLGPSSLPTTTAPSGYPSANPTTTIPTVAPSQNPSVGPTFAPSKVPTITPSSLPTTTPSSYPSVNPTSTSPTSGPSKHPSTEPTTNPTMLPSFSPTDLPTTTPSSYPSANPTTIGPTSVPSQYPSVGPSYTPTTPPSSNPSYLPTTTPSSYPSQVPSVGPTNNPTELPSFSPTNLPTTTPSSYPSANPTSDPTEFPSVVPSYTPTELPSFTPSSLPTIIPSIYPSASPTTTSPTFGPSQNPSTASSYTPTKIPSETPRTRIPSLPPLFVGLNRLQIMNRQAYTPKINPNSKLLLTGTILVEKECKAIWLSNFSDIDIAKQSLTPTSILVPPLTNVTLILYLPANILFSGETYIFSLVCNAFSTFISININSPPSLGNFSVSPAIGVELTESFQFAAFQWFDLDLPISYQFGFTSSGDSSLLVIQDQSLVNKAFSTLPAGSQSFGYKLKCAAQIFDSLGCSVNHYQTVIVSPAANSISLVSTAVSQLLTQNASRKQISQTIIIASSILNNVNCSMSIVCSSIGRLNCSTVAHTCGVCMPGLTGESGSHNSKCIRMDSIQVINNLSKTVCNVNADCSQLQICDLSTQKCKYPSKKCPNDCFSRGNCSYTNSYTGTSISECSQFSSECIASCQCIVGYAGIDCSLSTAELLQKQTLRQQLIVHLSSITAVSNKSSINANSVQSWATSLTSLTQSPIELSSQASSVALGIAQTILSSAATMSSVSYDSLSNVVDSISSISQSSQQSAQGESIKNLLSLYNTLALRDMVTGQSSVNNIQNNFRTTANVLNPYKISNITIESPVSLLEKELSSSKPNSLQLNLSSTAASSVQVSLVEVASKLYGNTNFDLMSNSLAINIVGINSLKSNGLREESTIIVNLQSNNPHYFDITPVNFTSFCSKGQPIKLITFTCPGSDFIIEHNCTAKHGKLISYCPILQPVCVVSNASPNIGKCTVNEYNSIETVCSCVINHQALNGSRKLSSLDAQTIVDSSGVMNLVSMSKYVGSEIADTFLSVEDFSSPDAFRKSLTVIVMFSSLWVGGIFLILFCGWRRKKMVAINEMMEKKVQRKTQSASISHSPAIICANLQDYISEIFPSVFGQQSHIHRLVDEVKKHHRYLNILTASPGDFGDRSRMLTGIQLLTIQTMLMFLLALFYDLQAPSDDGSCLQYYNKESCLSRKTYLDVSQTYCQWKGLTSRVSATDDINPCIYQDPTSSIQVMFYVAILVSITTSLFLRPIDKVFKLLSAPVADSIKVKKADNTLKKIGRRVSSTARRVSVMASDTAAVVAQQIGVQRFKKLIVGSSTVMIPESTKSAHQVASASMSLVTSISGKKLKQLKSNQLHLKASVKNSGGKSLEKDNSSNISNSDTESVEGEPDKINVVSKSFEDNKHNFSITEVSTDNLFLRLSDDIACQRKFLKPSEVDQFDNQWGIDPTGEFFKDSTRHCFKSHNGAEELIKKEINMVKIVTERKVEKLNLATDEHIGIEMLHLFILDLLGRETPAARVFQSKAEEDFIHTEVTTMRTRIFCYVFLVMINAFFIFFSILRGYTKGIGWQSDYLIACTIQIFVEMFLFETMECIWIQFCIPSLVSGEVQHVNNMLSDVIINLCSTIDKQDNIVLDATEYLFISTNLAKTYPDLMESMLILSYHTYLPGEISTKWKSGVSARIQRHNSVHQSALLLTTLVLLQSFATLPFFIHQMFVRFTQPFFLFGLFYLGSIIINNPLYTSLVAVSLFLVILYLIYQLFFKKKRQPLTISPITNDERSMSVHQIDTDEIIIVDFDQKEIDKNSDSDNSISANQDHRNENRSVNQHEGVDKQQSTILKNSKKDIKTSHSSSYSSLLYSNYTNSSNSNMSISDEKSILDSENNESWCDFFVDENELSDSLNLTKNDSELM